MGKQEYEFGGPLGACSLLLILPAVVYFLYFSCSKENGCISVVPLEFPPVPQVTFDDIYSNQALLVVCGWISFQALLYIIVPGPIIQGTVLTTGKTLPYIMNGLSCMVISILSVLSGHYFGIIELGYIFDHYIQLATGAWIFSTVLSVYLYASSSFGENVQGGPKILADHGNTGNPIYDFYIGRELNPRIGQMFDLKVFFELRPGLIGWAVIDLAMAVKQYENEGYVSNSMILICLFQIYYVADSFISEPALLTTMDVTTDGFGFMLAFGDIAWVPFTYSLQARYLVNFPVNLSPVSLVAIVLLNLLGLYIFRSANSQKNTFRSDPTHPSVQHLTYIKTERGTKLITSSFWGIARHINYFGDLLMGLAWCLPCGLTHVIPYYYVIYFAILLIHRDRRDDAKCHKKYGKDWEKYCDLVKYRIVPYVY